MWINLRCKKQWNNDMASEYQTADDIFECKLCGDCCKGFGGTYVSGADIEKIAAFIDADAKKFTAMYCDPSGSRFVLTRGEDGCCIFFDKEKQCTIHPVKPYMCRAWPFIKPVSRQPENWNAMANSCPGMKKDIPATDLKRIVTLEKKTLDKAVKE